MDEACSQTFGGSTEIQGKLNKTWLWLSRPRQTTGMNIDDYIVQFTNWKERMESHMFSADEESYIEDFIFGLEWDLCMRVRTSRLKPHNLSTAYSIARIEGAMMVIESFSGTKDMKAEAHNLFDKMPTLDSAAVTEDQQGWLVSNEESRDREEANNMFDEMSTPIPAAVIEEQHRPIDVDREHYDDLDGEEGQFLSGDHKLKSDSMMILEEVNIKNDGIYSLLEDGIYLVVRDAHYSLFESKYANETEIMCISHGNISFEEDNCLLKAFNSAGLLESEVYSLVSISNESKMVYTYRIGRIFWCDCVYGTLFMTHSSYDEGDLLLFDPGGGSSNFLFAKATTALREFGSQLFMVIIVAESYTQAASSRGIRWVPTMISLVNEAPYVAVLRILSSTCIDTIFEMDKCVFKEFDIAVIFVSYMSSILILSVENSVVYANQLCGLFLIGLNLCALIAGYSSVDERVIVLFDPGGDVQLDGDYVFNSLLEKMSGLLPEGKGSDVKITVTQFGIEWVFFDNQMKDEHPKAGHFKQLIVLVEKAVKDDGEKQFINAIFVELKNRGRKLPFAFVKNLSRNVDEISLKKLLKDGGSFETVERWKDIKFSDGFARVANQTDLVTAIKRISMQTIKGPIVIARPMEEGKNSACDDSKSEPTNRSMNNISDDIAGTYSLVCISLPLSVVPRELKNVDPIYKVVVVASPSINKAHGLKGVSALCWAVATCPDVAVEGMKLLVDTNGNTPIDLLISTLNYLSHSKRKTIHKQAGSSISWQAIISFKENGGDPENLVEVGKDHIGFLVNDTIYLGSISFSEEPCESVRAQLIPLYSQVVFILVKTLVICSGKDPKYDMTLSLSRTTDISQDVVELEVLFAILMCKHAIIGFFGAQKSFLYLNDWLVLLSAMSLNHLRCLNASHQFVLRAIIPWLLEG